MAREIRSILRSAAPPIRTLIARALRGPRRLPWIDAGLRQTADFVLDCKTVRENLSSLHDAELPRGRAGLMRAHLSTCAVCAPVDASLRSTIDLLRDLPRK